MTDTLCDPRVELEVAGVHVLGGFWEWGAALDVAVAAALDGGLW